eukprot:5401956-Pleurochrysis_carterae.AAC.1
MDGHFDQQKKSVLNSPSVPPYAVHQAVFALLARCTLLMNRAFFVRATASACHFERSSPFVQ